MPWSPTTRRRSCNSRSEPAAVTVTQALDLGVSRLRAGGVTHPPLDAELLLRHVLGWDRASILARGGDALSPAEEARFFDLVAARARRRPLQHLTGTQAFWRHEFVVGPAVLIPRPETETLVEAGLGLLGTRSAPRVIDVGTGSGCIALSLAAERRDAILVATDLSAAALLVARENASRLELAGRVRFVRGDLLDAFRSRPGAPPFDLVVSNPPYVREAEWRDLAPEVRDHDPRIALVPPDGVEALYGRLLAGAARVLRPGGAVAVEVGAGQFGAVAAEAAAAGFVDARTVRDLQAIPRVIVTTWPG
jgi:release factor glutamine methyltransferase